MAVKAVTSITSASVRAIYSHELRWWTWLDAESDNVAGLPLGVLEEFDQPALALEDFGR